MKAAQKYRNSSGLSLHNNQLLVNSKSKFAEKQKIAVKVPKPILTTTPSTEEVQSFINSALTFVPQADAQKDTP